MSARKEVVVPELFDGAPEEVVSAFKSTVLEGAAGAADTAMTIAESAQQAGLDFLAYALASHTAYIGAKKTLEDNLDPNDVDSQINLAVFNAVTQYTADNFGKV